MTEVVPVRRGPFLSEVVFTAAVIGGFAWVYYRAAAIEDRLEYLERASTNSKCPPPVASSLTHDSIPQATRRKGVQPAEQDGTEAIEDDEESDRDDEDDDEEDEEEEEEAPPPSSK